MVILVTGANRGICPSSFTKVRSPITNYPLGLGLAIVHALASRTPDSVILLGSRSISSGTEAVHELRQQGVSTDIKVVELDVTNDHSINSAVDVVGGKYKRIDCMLPRYQSHLARI